MRTNEQGLWSDIFVKGLVIEGITIEMGHLTRKGPIFHRIDHFNFVNRSCVGAK